MEQYKRIDRSLVHKGAIIEYYEDTIQVPNGITSKWDFINHKGAAAVLPVRDDGKIVLVRQYRPSLNRETIEIPAGGLEEGEPTIDAARRELEEETGYVCGCIEPFMSINTTVAFCNEKIDIYLATKLTAGEKHPDEDEFVDVEVYDLEELIKKINSFEITDSKTICAILNYKNRLCE